MDPLEDRVRHLLSDDSWRVDVDTDSALTKVHAGAKRRRARRRVGMAALAVLVVAGGAGGVGYLADVLSGQDRGEVTVATDQKDKGETFMGQSGPADSSQQGPAAPSSDPTTATREHLDSAVAKFAAVSFTASKADTFWVLGAETKTTAQVRSTDDGGKNFGIAGTIPAPVAAGTNQMNANTVSSLRFARDGANGWAYGRALYATHDGGGEWTKVDSLSGKVERLEVANNQAVALVNDNGAWSAWATPVASESWAELDVKLTKPSDLAVVGSQVLIADTSGDKAVVAASSNGGKSFDLLDTSCTADLGTGTLSVTADSVWLTCPTGMAASVFVSHDGGRTWDAVSSTNSLPNNALLGARTSSQTIVAVQGEVDILSDGGAPKTVKIPGLGQPTYAGFTNEKVGYVLDLDGELFRTTDGGQRWSPVKF